MGNGVPHDGVPQISGAWKDAEHADDVLYGTLAKLAAWLSQDR